MKCFILCRQSSGSTDPDESCSIEVQEAECQKLAQSKELEVVQTFREPSTSGRLYPVHYEAIAAQDWTYKSWCEETKKTGQYRPGLGEILTRLSEVGFIVCYDLTRFFRPLNGSFLSAVISQALQASSVKVLTVKEGVIDFGRFQDSLISSLTSQINSEQLTIQREKSKASLKKLKDAGEYSSSIGKLHGYRSVGGKKVEIDAETAPIVKDLFSLFLSGMGLLAVTRAVNEKYEPVLHGRFTRQVASNMLRNPLYCGYMHDSSGNIIKSKQTEGKELVSFEDWTAACRKLDVKKSGKIRTKKKWLPLSSFLKCGTCGTAMTLRASWGHDYGYYACNRYVEKFGERCENTHLRSSYSGKDGCGLIEGIKPLLLAYAVKRLKQSTKKDEASKELEALKVKAENFKRKEANLTRMYAEGTMDDVAFENAMKAVTVLKAETLKEIQKLEIEISTDDSAEKWLDLVIKIHCDDSKQYGMNKGEFELLANSMLKAVIVFEDHLDVKTVFGDVSIPRRKTRMRNVVCNRWIIVELTEKTSIDIVYYSGDKRDIEDGWQSNATLLGKLDEVNVWRY